MKTKITETTTREIDVETPYYTHDNICFWYKTISENNITSVFLRHDRSEARVSMADCLANSMRTANIQITEQQFNERFDEAITILVQNNYGKKEEDETLCEEIKSRAVNDGILTTNDTPSEYTPIGNQWVNKGEAADYLHLNSSEQALMEEIAKNKIKLNK